MTVWGNIQMFCYLRNFTMRDSKTIDASIKSNSVYCTHLPKRL